MERPPVHLSVHAGYMQLVLTDIAYIGVCGGQLHISAVIGEPFVARWDVARHIVRHFDAYYKDDDCTSVPMLEEYLRAVASRCFLPFGASGVFVDAPDGLPVKVVCIVRRGAARLCLSKLRGHSREVLRRLLLTNPCKHPAFATSRFWKINVSEHKRRVGVTVDALQDIPSVWVLDLVGERHCSASLLLLDTIWKSVE
jgi:hypothetical protein